MKIKALRLISISIVLAVSIIQARERREVNHKEIVVNVREKRQPYGIEDRPNYEFPYVVSIHKEFKKGQWGTSCILLRQVCGGTVIGSKYVLTSARCLKPNFCLRREDDMWPLYVIVGSKICLYNDLRPGPYQKLHKVFYSFTHPKFPQIDLAILVTKMPFSFSVIPMINFNPSTIYRYFLVGWGNYYKTNIQYDVSILLQTRSVRKLQRDNCPLTLENDMEKFVDELYYNHTICAKVFVENNVRYLPNPVGNSMTGSPLVIKPDNTGDPRNHILIGILSREFIDISKTPKLLITDTWKSVEWIKQITSEGEKKWPSINVSNYQTIFL